jgi:hypothetical protein
VGFVVRVQGLGFRFIRLRVFDLSFGIWELQARG